LIRLIEFGSSVDLKSRLAMHKSQLLHNRHKSSKLQRHANKYGVADLEFIIIEEINFISKTHLLQIEQYYIDLYKPWFNTNPMASSCLGVKRSKSTKLLYSKIQKNKFVSVETRKKQSEAKKGITPWNKGISCSEVWKINIGLGKTKGLPTKKQLKESLPRKFIHQFDLNMNFIKEWETFIEIQRCLKLNRKMISKYCHKNIPKPYHGSYFKIIIK